MTGDVRYSVLLVDDNPGDVELFQESLSTDRPDIDCVVTPGGITAMEYMLECVATNRLIPSVVVLDLNMPGRDGKELLKEIRSNPALRHTPIVVLTSSYAPVDIEMAYSLGANDFITKPGDLTRFREIVNEIEDSWLTTPPTTHSREDHK